jgi:hypothetical protein
MQFLIGVIFGIVLSTIGAQGVAGYVDHGVSFIKKQSIEFSKNK